MDQWDGSMDERKPQKQAPKSNVQGSALNLQHIIPACVEALDVALIRTPLVQLCTVCCRSFGPANTVFLWLSKPFRYNVKLQWRRPGRSLALPLLRRLRYFLAVGEASNFTGLPFAKKLPMPSCSLALTRRPTLSVLPWRSMEE
jgi:hypothetical protein